jgi:hypothetical protein
MLVYMLTFHLISICLCILDVEDTLWISSVGSCAQPWSSSIHFVSISICLAYLILQFISRCHFICCGLPQAIERFPRNIIVESTGDISLLGLFGDFSPSFLYFFLSFCVSFYLTTSILLCI